MKTRAAGTWARWGWLLTTLGLGLAVIGSAWTNYRSAERAADDLIRGEAHTLRDAVLATGPHFGSRGTDRAFDSLVTAQAEGGLRYVAWVHRDGTIDAKGGVPDPTPIATPIATTEITYTRLGSRMRVFLPPPRRAEEADRRDVGVGPPIMMMEFQPVVAAQMLSRAKRSLVTAAVASAVLMAAGLGFWRLSRRVEESDRRMEEQRRLAALGQMSAVLAHEIRNPLASLKGHAQLLVERLPANTNEARKADWVVQEATRLEVLTSDLLDFARVGPLDLQSIDPAALLRTAAREATSRPIEVDVTGAPDRWPLDERRFGQAVLVNLLRNAVQASPADRPPRASVTRENGALVFTVRDTGAGIPPGEESRIFEPFYTTRTAGTGLGLAIARRIVELHGGSIRGENAPDGGAVFRVELPGPA